MSDFQKNKEKYEFLNIEFREGEVFYLDTNIFMSKDVVFFLSSLSDNKVYIPRFQYNELYKLKSSDNDKKAYKARRAFRMLEEFYEKGIFIIEDLSKDNGKSYADPEFIKTILKDLNDSKKISFIVEDRELRLTLKIEVDKNPKYKELLNIYTLDDLKERKIKETKEEKINRLRKKRAEKKHLRRNTKTEEKKPKNTKMDIAKTALEVIGTIVASRMR